MDTMTLTPVFATSQLSVRMTRSSNAVITTTGGHRTLHLSLWEPLMVAM